jgi:hypothetical protein
LYGLNGAEVAGMLGITICVDGHFGKGFENSMLVIQLIYVCEDFF